MTAEQELARMKRDYAEHWNRLESNPEFAKALAEKDLIELGEIANRLANGNYQTAKQASIRRNLMKYE